MKIILATLNSRYTHTSLALRYLYANMQELQQNTRIMEFSINDAMQSVAEKILDQTPDILGLGVYIWNAQEIQELIHIIKKTSPKTKIVLGGPEVSYEPFRINLDDADFIIQGEGDIAFYELCKNILDNKANNRIIPLSAPKLKELQLPYEYYSDEDIQNRYIYVEISRGCPFECEFCLSSMDEKVRAFDLEKVLEAFEKLWKRGARNFKFVDRTFNLNMKAANMELDMSLWR
ncbi:MAG: cobalamin-dependent protein [Sulfurimonas sp.]